MEISIDIEGVESTIKLVTEENDKIAVLGQNGSGKTTFLKALSGLYVPKSGIIKYNKEIKIEFPMSYLSYKKWERFIKKSVLYLDNSSFFYKELSIKDNVEYFSEIGDFNRIKIYDDLIRYKIGESLNKPIKYLSEGTRQKLVIIFAINTTKSLILLDEPDKNLDEETLRRFYDDINKIKERSVIMSTHTKKSIVEEIGYKVLTIDKKESMKW